MENIFLYFMIYSFLGWLCECIYCSIPEKKFINRGFLMGPYCPIYGFGALLVLYLLHPFASNIVILFLAGVIVTSILEYITSWIMEVMFHTKWWDYSTYRFNIHGRVCLRNSLMFGVLSIVVYCYIHPHIVSLIQAIPTIYKWLISILIGCCFVYDLINTTIALLKRNKDIVEIEARMNELKKEFRKQIQTLSDETFAQNIKNLLDGKIDDEKLTIQVQKLYDFIEEKKKRKRKVHERISRAFPHRIERNARLKIEEIFTTIQKYLEK